MIRMNLGGGAIMTPEQAQRRRWMGALAQAELSLLESVWTAMAPQPGYRTLRGPEIGLAQIRGRIGGDGRVFNLGEMTVTRCTVELAGGTVGHAYVAGRQPRKTELAAVFDAMMTDPRHRDFLEQRAIAPALAAVTAMRAQIAEEAASTRVDFFTMPRGE